MRGNSFIGLASDFFDQHLLDYLGKSYLWIDYSSDDQRNNPYASAYSHLQQTIQKKQ